MVPRSVEHVRVHLLTPANQERVVIHDLPFMEVGNLCKDILPRNDKHAASDETYASVLIEKGKQKEIKEVELMDEVASTALIDRFLGD